MDTTLVLLANMIKIGLMNAKIFEVTSITDLGHMVVKMED
jgi:hypothetical protein